MFPTPEQRALPTTPVSYEVPTGIPPEAWKSLTFEEQHLFLTDPNEFFMRHVRFGEKKNNFWLHDDEWKRLDEIYQSYYEEYKDKTFQNIPFGLVALAFKNRTGVIIRAAIDAKYRQPSLHHSKNTDDIESILDENYKPELTREDIARKTKLYFPCSRNRFDSYHYTKFTEDRPEVGMENEDYRKNFHFDDSDSEDDDKVKDPTFEEEDVQEEESDLELVPS